MADFILQSYLIKIGYKIDQESTRQFKQNLAETSKGIKEWTSIIASGLTGAAIAAGTAMFKISTSGRELLITAEKLGLSIGKVGIAGAVNLDALGFAFKQVTGDASDAQRVIGTLATNLLTLPDTKPFLESFFGIEMGKDQIENFFNIMTKMKEITEPHQRAISVDIAQKNLGLGPLDFNLLISGDALERLRAQFEWQKANTSITKQFLENSDKLVEALNTLSKYFENFVIWLADKGLSAFEGILKLILGEKATKELLSAPEFQGKEKTSIHDLVRQKAIEAGVDPNLAAAFARQESGFSQAALSAKGAIGVMQLMPNTAKVLGVDPTKLEENIRGGVQYIKDLVGLFPGNEELAIASYLYGPYKDKTHLRTEVPLGAESYVRNIEQYKLGEQKAAQPNKMINQKTDIHVDGTGDPAAVADRVLRNQDDINADLVRYLGLP